VGNRTKFSGVKAENPLMLARLEWSFLEEGKIMFDSQDGAGLGATNATLKFDLRLGEPARMREESAVTGLRITLTTEFVLPFRGAW
jgi:hypothetical protein